MFHFFIKNIKKIIINFTILALTLLFYKTPFLFAGPYLDSAHGNNTYGVISTSRGTGSYARGNCAHCHEQHASINGAEPLPPPQSGPSPYAIFTDNFTDQATDFCFYCHQGVGSLQDDFDRTNYNYSYWFGGDTVNHLTPNNIYDTFNPTAGSTHNLQDILNFVKTKWPATFNDESNPCSACHNPHLAQRGYPIVRPTDRNNIWGDEPGEMMSDYAAAHGGQYQAPYRWGGGVYEPDGSGTTDGSNLPDYVTFCSDCHNATNVIYSSSLVRNVKPIDWTNQVQVPDAPGDYHGAITRCQDRDGSLKGWGSLKEPYYSTNAANFILSCTDCHESHGAVNGLDSHGGADTTPYFLRKTINNFYNGYVPTGAGPTYSWSNGFCRSCHGWNSHCGGPGGCIGCHYHNSNSGCWGASPCGPGSGHTF